MSRPGITVMLHSLFNRNEKDEADKYYGKIRKSAEMNEEKVTIEFEDGIKIELTDEGQSCCEYRYISCDDDVNRIIGSELVKIEIKKTEEKEEDYEIHEMAFVDIQTNQCFITFCTHNEHNGYYGGFILSLKEVQEE